MLPFKPVYIIIPVSKLFLTQIFLILNLLWTLNIFQFEFQFHCIYFDYRSQNKTIFFFKALQYNYFRIIFKTFTVFVINYNTYSQQSTYHNVSWFSTINILQRQKNEQDRQIVVYKSFLASFIDSMVFSPLNGCKNCK